MKFPALPHRRFLRTVRAFEHTRRPPCELQHAPFAEDVPAGQEEWWIRCSALFAADRTAEDGLEDVLIAQVNFDGQLPLCRRRGAVAVGYVHGRAGGGDAGQRGAVRRLTLAICRSNRRARKARAVTVRVHLAAG